MANPHIGKQGKAAATARWARRQRMTCPYCDGKGHIATTEPVEHHIAAMVASITEMTARLGVLMNRFRAEIGGVDLADITAFLTKVREASKPGEASR